jgi:hypothetical protein
MSSPAAPLLFKLVPFPSLEDAQELEGAIEVKLTHTVGRGGGGQLAKIYVRAESGRTEINCGYLMDRTPCPDFNLINGSTGKVWYHRLFGVVQWRLVNSNSGRVSEISRDATMHYHEYGFSSEKYIRTLCFSVAFLAASIFIFRKNSARSDRDYPD